jgi:predicted nucleotidyltransferase component of viral defense system
MPAQPIKPTTLDPRAVALLEWMGAQPWAGFIVLGGGVALKHYLDYRGTKDCDAWWHADAGAEDRRRIVSEVAEVLRVQNPGAEIRLREFNEVNSVELFLGGQAKFSFQIAKRDVQLEPYLPSGWGGIGIESLNDNLASKMCALVDRGYPRDLRDIRRAARDLGFSIADLWTLWQRKNPTRNAWDAKVLIRKSLEAIIRRRPLENIPDKTDRAEANEVRQWFLKEFLHDESRN